MRNLLLYNTIKSQGGLIVKGGLYLDSDKKIYIDPRYIGVVVERLLKEKFRIPFDGSVSSDKNSVSDTTIAEIKVYCKDIKKF